MEKGRACAGRDGRTSSREIKLSLCYYYLKLSLCFYNIKLSLLLLYQIISVLLSIARTGRRGDIKLYFSCSAHHEQDWQTMTRLIDTLLYINDLWWLLSDEHKACLLFVHRPSRPTIKRCRRTISLPGTHSSILFCPRHTSLILSDRIALTNQSEDSQHAPLIFGPIKPKL